MKNYLSRTFGLSALALLLSGCYTQLAVVERPVYTASEERIAERSDEGAMTMRFPNFDFVTIQEAHFLIHASTS